MARATITDTSSPWKDMKRTILDSSGNEVAVLDDNDSNYYTDGTAVDWDAVESAGYNVMVRIPKFYYKKEEIDGGFIFGVSDVPHEGYEVHPAFFRCRDRFCDDQSGVAVEVDYRYCSAFLGWYDGSKLRSLPNKLPTRSISTTSARNFAKENGIGWSLYDYYLHYAIQILYITEYADRNSQSQVGYGYVNYSSGKKTGYTKLGGNSSYSLNGISYRGIEDFWGNYERFCDGFCTDGSRNMLIADKGYNDNGSGYVNKGKFGSSNKSGFITNIQSHKDCGFIPYTVGTLSMDGKIPDRVELNSSALLTVGGRYNSGSDAGFVCFYCSRSSSGGADIAYSLAF